MLTHYPRQQGHMRAGDDRGEVEHFTTVDPTTGAKAFYTRNSKTGAEARGYAYNSENDPNFRKRHNINDPQSKYFVQRQVFVYSSGSPQQQQTPTRERTGKAHGGHAFPPPHPANTRGAVVVEEAAAEQEDEAMSMPETDGAYHPSTPSLRPGRFASRHPRYTSPPADTVNTPTKQRTSAAMKPPIVEEPEDDGDNGLPVIPTHRDERHHSRSHHHHRSVGDDDDGDIFLSPFASMERRMAQMQQDMLQHMHGMMQLSGLGFDSRRHAERERDNVVASSLFPPLPLFSALGMGPAWEDYPTSRQQQRQTHRLMERGEEREARDGFTARSRHPRGIRNEDPFVAAFSSFSDPFFSRPWPC